MTQGMRREVQDLIMRVEREGLLSRIWARDHRVWNESPAEIENRLGWLDLPRSMLSERRRLADLSAQAIRDGVEHVVLLGMGGSSLAPEVFSRSFPREPGHPALIVLESTVPDAVRAVREAIDPTRTLFIVSSKSGTTIEPLTFMDYFWEETAAAAGGDPGGRFWAITDPGTPLVDLARQRGFGMVVENPPDIGGRYAALSLVGLVPAGLMGVGTADLLRSAGLMAEACGEAVPPGENPAAVLAATMVAAARSGRDKLTVWASEPIERFGLWLEQLVAESLGKSGLGVVPVVGEPLLDLDDYGDDRVFVLLSMDGCDDGPAGDAFERLGRLGHPTVRLELEDLYDLGAQFLLWELATAVAGAFLGLNPFDQPDVEASKVAARQALDGFEERATSPDVAPRSSLEALLEEVRLGDYVAIMAYVHETPGTEEALGELRRAVSERRRIATTVGYGPRFLHSTGQMHKGGPDSIACLQIVGESVELPVPGRGYGFKVLADAQASGDLEALEARGRRVAREVVGADTVAGIEAMARRAATTL